MSEVNESSNDSTDETSDAAPGPMPRPSSRLTSRPATDQTVGPKLGEDPSSRARELLRQHTDSGWKAIEADVLDRALRLFRPSAPVRARHEGGEYFVASDIVVAQLRRVVDSVAQVAAQRISCVTTDDDHLESVTVEIIAAFGTPLLQAAGRVHTAALSHLQEMLGDLAPLATQIHTHVHIGDITEDPRQTM